MLNENVFDFFMILILVFALYRGAAKGFVYQVATIAAIILCFVFSGQLSVQLAPVISNFGAKPPLDRWLAMLVLYVGFSFLSFGVARMLHGWLEKVKLKEYDRHLGAIFGLFKGFVFCMVLIFFLVTISESARAQIIKSYSAQVAAIVMDRLHPVLPEGVSQAIHKFADIHALDRDGLGLEHTDHDHGQDGHDQEGHNHGDDPFGNDTYDPFDLNKSKSSSEEQGGEDRLKDFVKSLPGLEDNKTRNTILSLLENTTPEEREELMQKLKSGDSKPGFFQSFAETWLKREFGSRGEKPAKIDRQKMISEIAALQSKSPRTRAKIINSANTALNNVPEQVADGAVADWYADLFALDVDPDPETDFATSIGERITRQLKAAGLPLSNLPQPFFKN